MRRRQLSLGLAGTAVLALGSLLLPAQPASAAGPRPDFRAPWPCGEGRDYYHHSSEVHNAIDFNIAGSADLGTPALASASGTVIDAVPMPNSSGYGNYVRVDHGGGWTSLVAHLDRISVAKGQYVRTGDELGKVGNTGESFGAHLHYEQEADGQNMPIVVDRVALRYSATAARHTSGNCGTPQPLLAGSPTDFTGDGVDDIVTFTQNAEADVYVAPSTRAGFGEAKEWHDFFAPGGETPLTGDFNGDHKDDVVTFTKGPDSDVYVALSNGNNFGTATVWHDHFAPGSEVPAVGDVNGDGYDDIVTFTHDADAKVYVALSNGKDGFHTATVWHDFFAPAGEFPALGDIDGDGDDDLITFTQGTTADVYAALSNGKDAFGTGKLVHDHFAPAGELPRIGDVNGDKKDDILAFTQGTESDVYVALSDGNKYGPGTRWNDFFSPTGEFPYVGDYDGDGKDDIVTFTHNTDADVYVSVSNGTDAFVDGRKWHDFFGTPGETSL
ncbi:peptidoglycan DD-metalloendopeptidase family protein [Streptomyces coelicoflavus]|uniref:peptidoglycan DD-metalloendopeptidase family protein n=1 Tax=Streptomyces coelicoflavus TaxID=285562 RepID=UPI000D5A2086|nr:peptidoglycan DD-metalloendopeptidase family protein [Streptomyces coelicoflavus]